MRKKMKMLFCIVTLLVLSLSLVACSNNDKQEPASSQNEAKESKSPQTEKKTIKIATMTEVEPVVSWIKEGLKPLGYDIEIVIYGSNQLPATALKDGDVDGLILNQLLWIKTFNKQNNCELHMVEPYMYHGATGMFSSKHKSLDELPQNAKIAIPGDPSNMEHALMGLQKGKLITLGEKTGEFYSLLDITANPKNIEFIETERGTTARSIKDVDAIVCGSDEARRAGIDIKNPIYDGFFSENYPHGLVVNPKDIDADWVKEIMKFVKTDDFKTKFNDEYQGTVVLFDK